jgi:hypothetical protein
MNDSDCRTMQAYLARPLADLMDELAVYDTTKGMGDVWDKVAGPVHQRLCVEWRWCELRQDARFDDKLTLGLAVASALAQPILHLPFPADLALIAAIVVKTGLDKFCGCS